MNLSCSSCLDPWLFLPEHPFLDRVPRSRSLDTYIDALKVELAQYNPALTVIGSEVFSEFFPNGQACLRLIARLSLSFSSTSILLARRDVKVSALSSLKHMQRDLFLYALTGFERAFVNPIAVFHESISHFDKVVKFWHESGLTVQARYLDADLSRLQIIILEIFSISTIQRQGLSWVPIQSREWTLARI